ncbi:Alpha/Beta hydrolase protein [Exophiala viscosa]|uniref:Alpha/Beta hydrolase protein n=1 Tax=Exophiala viscosa TaxID=2486360 RepID=A0AAN6DTL3_9EURO|nr:Alpha/Beta hydrolase protein [Exophiala viscosa]
MKKPQLYTSDYLNLLYAVSRGLASLTWAASTGWARGDAYPPEYGKHVVYAAVRQIFELVTVPQTQAIGETTGEAYLSWCKKHKIEPSTVDLAEGGRGLFVGPASARNTILYFHGGGYNLGATPAHFDLLLSVVNKAKENGSDLRAMVLEYELAPHGIYPLQLKQAVAALKYLLDAGVQPSQILIAGDSAGGNLTAGLLGHLSHPHASLPEVSLSGDLGGAFFYSPWVSFDTTSDSFKRNIKKDALSIRALAAWSRNFMGAGKNLPDNYNTPKDAPAEWWKDLKVNDKDIAITAGANEVLVDGIREFADHVKVHNPNLEYVEFPNEGHDAYTMDRAFGLTGPLRSEDFAREWLLARVKATATVAPKTASKTAMLSAGAMAVE